MVIHGSSRIDDLTGISPLTGASGSRGQRGPTGPTGTTGGQGPIGYTGEGIKGAVGTRTAGPSSNEYQIVVTLEGYNEEGSLEEGITLGITGVRGNTGTAETAEYSITNTIQGPDYGELFKEKIGITAYFRNLTVSGRDITVNQPDDYTILLSGATGDGRLGNTGELIFAWDSSSGGLSGSGAKNTYWENHHDGEYLQTRILRHRERWQNTTDNNNLPVWNTDPTNTTPVVSVSGVTGTSVTFSSIVASENYGGPAGSTAIASGIHLGGGEVYRFPGVTFSSQLLQTDVSIGSCCYCTEDQDPNKVDHRDCIDYVTKLYCDEVGGKFSDVVCLHRSEGPNCYSEGACCVNGRCIDTSETKCQTYGGLFVQGIPCIDPFGGTSIESLGGCVDPCTGLGACCINNECYEMSQDACAFYPEGIWFDKTCDQTNCCLEGNYGACCVDEVCYQTTPAICSSLESNDGTSRGIYWGTGSKCAGLNLIQGSGVADAAYAPFNCLVDGDDGPEIGGLLDEGGNCVCDSTPPPCTCECTGWTYEYGDGSCGDDTPCLCPGIDCHCSPTSDPSYSCKDGDSCGTIKLVDNKCWECCRNQPNPDELNPTGACCIDVNGAYTCSQLTDDDCWSRGGVFVSGKLCANIDCDSGACCVGTSCSPELSISECWEGGGIWTGGDCDGESCTTVRTANDFGSGDSPSQPSYNIISSRRKLRKTNKSVQKSSKERKPIPKPKASGGCSGVGELSSCMEPGIVIPPKNKDRWIIEAGYGDCDCCCPEACWKGALGEGGIVSDCKDLGGFAVFDCSGGECNSNETKIKTTSLPTNISICNKPEQWQPNKHGCVPYLDETSLKNPVWMTCSCCLPMGGCKEYKNPIPCSECENKQGICVNGCDGCFT